MSHNQIEIMKIDWIIVIIIVGIIICKFLQDCAEEEEYYSRFKRVKKSIPPDQWVGFRSKIPGIVAWAKTIDVKAIAEKTKGLPQIVEETAGYPSSWLRFGEFLESSEKPSIGDALDFGRSLEGNARSWFKEYVKSTFGNESISLSAIEDFNLNQRKFFDEVFNIEEFAYRILGNIHELRDYFQLVSLLESVRSIGVRDRLAERLHDRKNAILATKYQACRTMDDHIAFFRTLPSYVNNDYPYWKDAHRMRQKVAYFIEMHFDYWIQNATSSEYLERLIIPEGIYEYGRPMSENLNYRKGLRINELREKELRERIQREIAGK